MHQATQSRHFLDYISSPAIKQICSGQLLQDLLVTIVDPPTLWNALHDCAANELFERKCHIWFRVAPLGIAPSTSERLYRRHAYCRLSDHLKISAQLPSHKVRVLGHKIQHLLRSTSSSTSSNSDANSPGGRHDNDFVDYRDIAIFPTGDELLSNTQPFYRLAREIATAEPKDRVGMRPDNQFRLAPRRHASRAQRCRPDCHRASKGQTIASHALRASSSQAWSAGNPGSGRSAS